MDGGDRVNDQVDKGLEEGVQLGNDGATSDADDVRERVVDGEGNGEGGEDADGQGTLMDVDEKQQGFVTSVFLIQP
jgi:hypothetical protein